MEWTANRLIPAILGGGVVLGLLASTAVTTMPKAPEDPPWRLAAREAAFKPSGYTYVDSGPMDLSPYLPWIGTGPKGSVAPMPEDFYRGRVIPIRANDYAAIPPLPPNAQSETADHGLDERPAAMRREVDEDFVRPAVVEVADEPRFASEPRLSDEAVEAEEEDPDLGG